MNRTITTTLSETFFSFLGEESKRKKITKKAIIEKGLEYYRKAELKKEIKNGFKNRKQEYKDINNSLSETQFNSIKY